MFASLFNERALWYRHEKGFPLFAEKGIAVAVQKMVRSDLACSGIGFSQEPVSLANYLISIDASWGLAEPIVRGEVTPDRFLVQKPLSEGKPLLLIGKALGAKEKKMVYLKSGIKNNTSKEQGAFSLTDNEALDVANAIQAISLDYGRPMDVEWAKDGVLKGKHTDGKIYIVQARPATYERDPLMTKHCRVQGQGEVVARGLIASPGLGGAKGNARLIMHADSKEKFETGSVLVAPMTDPDWLPLMKRASAIVTDRGGKNCHAAIVARELGIPCIVATGNATKVIKNNTAVTVDCDSGEEGIIMKGLLPIKEEQVDLRQVIEIKKSLKTKVMMIMADPSASQQYSHYPNDGIGLARMEFVLTRSVQFHPLLAVHPKKVLELSKTEKESLKLLTSGYKSLEEYFISKLEDGVSQLSASVYPNPAIVRFSDFKSNEYAGLIGGKLFEPHEENPMLGFKRLLVVQ
jgi:pyruvate,water dikinase